MSSKKTDDEKFFRFSNPLAWGTIITIVFLGVTIWLGLTDYCQLDYNGTQKCSSKFQQFWSSSPNEVGDTLAGIAGALAFLWIIITVMIQSQELTAQREELRLNRNESRKMAEAMSQQVNLLKLEREIREEERTIKLVDEKLLLVMKKLKFYRRNLNLQFQDGVNINLLGESELMHLAGEEFYISLAGELKSSAKSIEQWLERSEIKKKLTNRESINNINEELIEIFDKYNTYSDRLNSKISLHRISQVNRYLSRIVEQDIWVEEEDQT